MKNLLWELFKNTGKIEYYLRYKREVEHEKSKGGPNV